MCGIAGFYTPNINYSENPKKYINILNHMIKTMKMRGPDDEGYTITNHCCFAHSRLSIIDIENGSQPLKISYNQNNYYLIYNGEIYNHIDIRKQLQNKKIKFESNSDTEVILRAFLYWGPDFVNHLNGIFAIAIYDEMRNTLYLFRDRFGIKPLYYTKLFDTIVFASRIDTLFEYPRVKPSIDIKGFNEIFTLGPAKTYGFGIFTGINEVLPGEYIKIFGKNIYKTNYYKIKSVPHTDSYEEALEKITYLVEDSVKMQMLSDVPICTFLSGGLDSSLVTAICSKNSSDIISSYSFDFVNNDKYFKGNYFQCSEDRPYVDIMVDYLKTKHEYLYVSSEEIFSLLYDSVDSRCLPTMADVDTSLLHFCKLVAKNHKVALTGECADEIFGGYPWFHNKAMFNSKNFPWMPDISFRKSLLNPEFAAVLHMEQYIQNAYEKTISEVEILPGEKETDESRRMISYLNIRWFMQTLLDRMDRTSMNSGLEARVPFADHRIIDYLYNLPWEIKSKDNVPKHILREVGKKYLPDEIMNRKKCPYPKTYDPNYERMLVNELKEILNDGNQPIKCYLNLPVVNSFLDQPKEYGKPWYGQLMAGPQMIAYLLQINYWMKKYSLSM